MKKSFVLYLDYKSHLDLIEDNDDYRKLVDGIFEYQLTGTIPNLSPRAEMAFSFIKANLDRDSKKYDQLCLKNKENAKIRWDKENADESDGMRPHAMDADTDIGIGIETETDILPPSAPKKIKRKSQVPEDFRPSDRVKIDLVNKYPSLNIDNEIQAFIDFHISKGTPFSDFDRALRTWCRNAIKFNPPKKTKASEEEDRSSAWVDEQLRISERNN